MSDGLERVCVIIGRSRHKMVVAELQEAVRQGAKLIELRLDFLAKAIDFQRLLPYRKCPWVVTLRRPRDGGRWPGTEDERLMILRQAIVSGVDYVDLEEDIAASVPRFGKVQRIISYHNLIETPADLDEIYRRMLEIDGDIYKLAVTSQTPADNVRILELLRNAPKPTIAHGMGEIGFPTRLLSLKYGSPFTYAAFNRERGVAPGIPTFDEMRMIYPIGTLNPDTKIFGVAGDPVGHSLSPILHNLMYREMEIDALYLPFRIMRGHFQQSVAAYDSIPVSGYSVTIPHKEAAASMTRNLDRRVIDTGAANTLLRKAKGDFGSWNTDFDAAIDSIRPTPPKNEDGTTIPWNEVQGLVLGAGGAARAIVHALKREGIAVTVSNRTPERAAKLAAEVEGRSVDWAARNSVRCQLIINCTPIGMHPNVDESPIHNSVLKPGLVVFDTVYAPENTLLIKEAKQRGCEVVTGIEMFVRQAAQQFRIFTGQDASLEAMRKLMRKILSPLGLQSEL